VSVPYWLRGEDFRDAHARNVVQPGDYLVLHVSEGEVQGAEENSTEGKEEKKMPEMKTKMVAIVPLEGLGSWALVRLARINDLDDMVVVQACAYEVCGQTGALNFTGAYGELTTMQLSTCQWTFGATFPARCADDLRKLAAALSLEYGLDAQLTRPIGSTSPSSSPSQARPSFVGSFCGVARVSRSLWARVPAGCKTLPSLSQPDHNDSYSRSHSLGDASDSDDDEIEKDD